MYYLWNKLILLICCALLTVLTVSPGTVLLPLLFVIFLTAIIGFYDSVSLNRGIFILYFFLCFWNGIFLFFLPALLYDFFMEEPVYFSALYALPAVWHLQESWYLSGIFLITLLLLSYSLKYFHNSYQKLLHRHQHFQDDMTESSDKLLQKNSELLEKQDYEVKLATLDERNRIAREIHDSVGHLISSSLIQVGALIAISKDDLTKEYLIQLKETLSTGMDNIRTSIHNIHEKSVDLEAYLQNLADNFHFCDIDFQYNFSTDPPIKAKYSFIFIVKEALSNIMKHSDASQVTLSFQEHPAFYQIIVRDNGTTAGSGPDGMGISSMQERVEQLHGNMTINYKKGYRIFITVPKGDSTDETDHNR